MEGWWKDIRCSLSMFPCLFEAQLLPKKYAEHQAVKEQLAGSILLDFLRDSATSFLCALVSPRREAGRRCRRHEQWLFRGAAANPSRTIPGAGAICKPGTQKRRYQPFDCRGSEVLSLSGCTASPEMQSSVSKSRRRLTMRLSAADFRHLKIHRCEKEAVKCAGAGLGPISARQGRHVCGIRNRHLVLKLGRSVMPGQVGCKYISICRSLVTPGEFFCAFA